TAFFAFSFQVLLSACLTFSSAFFISCLAFTSASSNSSRLGPPTGAMANSLPLDDPGAELFSVSTCTLAAFQVSILRRASSSRGLILCHIPLCFISLLEYLFCFALICLSSLVALSPPRQDDDPKQSCPWLNDRLTPEAA